MVAINGPLTGADLRAYRKAAGLSQARMAERAEISRDTVQYWEAKAFVDVTVFGPKAILNALGLLVCLRSNARARGWGITHADIQQRTLNTRASKELERLRNRSIHMMFRKRVICGAKTRKGIPCQNKSEPGRRRCKFHGGKSTGPKTVEGRQRIAKAQRARWEKFREA